VVQAVEHLLNECEVLSSNSRTTKRKERRWGGEGRGSGEKEGKEGGLKLFHTLAAVKNAAVSLGL
jgi:hypothetical protein